MKLAVLRALTRCDVSRYSAVWAMPATIPGIVIELRSAVSTSLTGAGNRLRAGFRASDLIPDRGATGLNAWFKAKRIPSCYLRHGRLNKNQGMEEKGYEQFDCNPNK